MVQKWLQECQRKLKRMREFFRYDRKALKGRSKKADFPAEIAFKVLLP
jgi:hypothetical protein